MASDTEPLLPQTRPSDHQAEVPSRQERSTDEPPTYTPRDQGYYGAVDDVNDYISRLPQSQPRYTISGYFRQVKYTIQQWWNRYGCSLMLGAGAIAAGIVVLYLFYLDYMEGMCSLPAGTEMFTSTSVFPPSKDIDFLLHVQEGIYGNIFVRESDDWTQRNITVRMSSGSRLPNFLDTIAHDVFHNPLARTAKIFVHLGTTDPKETKRLLNDNCFRTDVEILYPRSSFSSSSDSTGRLEVQVVYGEIALDFGKPLTRKPAAIFESLGIVTMKGDVALKNVGVLERTRIRTERGCVKGSLLTPSSVDVSTKSGNIDLKVYSTALERGGSQYPTFLDVMLASKSGDINLKLSPSFNGHFELTSTMSAPKITASNWIRYTTNTTTKIMGWISNNGWEPPYNLPRIDLYSGGQVSATIG